MVRVRVVAVFGGLVVGFGYVGRCRVGLGVGVLC